MNTEPKTLAELANLFPTSGQLYDTGGGCMVFDLSLSHGFTLIFTDWANETGFDVGLYADWANGDEPINMWAVSSAGVVDFIERISDVVFDGLPLVHADWALIDLGGAVEC